MRRFYIRKDPILQTQRERQLWNKGVDLLLGSNIAFKFLVVGFEMSYQDEKDSTSYNKAADQLGNLATAADDLAAALDALDWPAAEAAFYIGRNELMNTALLELRDKAEGIECNPRFNNSIKSLDLHSNEDMIEKRFFITGCEVWLYRIEQLKALANMCTNRKADLIKKADIFNGVKSIYRVESGSPVSHLFDKCVHVLQLRKCSMENLKPLARIIYELVSGDKPRSRWGEREYREAKRYAQTLV